MFYSGRNYSNKGRVDKAEAIRRRRELVMRDEEIAEAYRNEAKIKAKLEVSQPEDAQEKEADTIARKVVDGSDGNIPKINAVNNSVQTKSEGDTLHAPESLQRPLDSSKGQGQSLPENVQSDIGGKMGADLSDIKIHTGSNAHDMSESVNAKAFTHGQDIYFKNGNYNTNSSEGKELLAHEVVHTVQNKGGGATIQPKIQRQIGWLTESEYRSAIQSNKIFHSNVNDSSFEEIKEYIGFVLLNKTSELPRLYHEVSEAGTIDRNYVNMVIALQQSLFPFQIKKHTGILGITDYAEMLKQVSFAKTNPKQGKEIAYSGNKQIDDAISYNWDKGFLGAFNKVDQNYLELLLDGTKKVEPYEKIVNKNSLFYESNNFESIYKLFVDYVRSAQEFIYPGNILKQTGKLDEETIYLLHALKGDVAKFSGTQPEWLKKAVTANATNYGAALALRLFKITNNRQLYQDALADSGKGISFSLLIWQTQIMTGVPSSMVANGQFDIITSLLLTTYEGLTKSRLDQNKVKKAYFDLTNYEQAFEVNSIDAYALKEEFAKRIYKKSYDQLTAKEDVRLFDLANAQFIPDDEFQKMMKKEGYDLTISRFINFDHAMKRSFYGVFGSVFKGVAVALKDLMAPVDLVIYSPRFYKVFSSTVVFEELHKIEKQLYSFQRMQLNGYDVGNAINSQESILKKYVEENKTRLHYTDYQDYLNNKDKTAIERSPIYQYGVSMDEKTKQEYPVNPKFKGEFWADTLPSAAGAAAGYILSELISKALLIPPGVSSGIIGVLGGMGNGYQLAIQYGADENTALSVSFLFGLTGLLQAIPFSRFMSSVERITAGRLSSEIFKIVFKEAMTQGTLMSSVTFVSGIFQHLTIKEYLDSTQAIFDTGLWKEAGAAFILGFLLGGITGYIGAKKLQKAELLRANKLREQIFKILYPDKALNTSLENASETTMPTNENVVGRKEALLEMRRLVNAELEQINDTDQLEKPKPLQVTRDKNNISTSFTTRAQLLAYLAQLNAAIDGLNVLLKGMNLNWLQQLKLAGYNLANVREKFGSDGSKAQDRLLAKAWKEGWRPEEEVPEEYKDKLKELNDKKQKQVVKTKTTGIAEDQLSDQGRYYPVPLTGEELAKVMKWQNLRNKYLQKWREMDLSKYSKVVQDLLTKRPNPDNSIRKNMNPDDIAGTLKEKRGVIIIDKTNGEILDHVTETENSMKNIKNRILEIKKLMTKPNLSQDDISILQQKLSDLSEIRDTYNEIIP